MRKEWMIERQGKQVVLYQGLLNEAHEHGLVSVEVSILQIPNKENSFVAIASATVTMGRGEEVRTFTEIGDASPANVSTQMQSAIIRMAATRAKARAMRDAVNIGVTAAEEMSGDEYQGSVVREPDPRYANRPSMPTSSVRAASAPADSAEFKKSQIKERIKRMGGPEDSKGQAEVMVRLLGEKPDKWDKAVYDRILASSASEWNSAVDTYLLEKAQEEKAA